MLRISAKPSWDDTENRTVVRKVFEAFFEKYREL